MCRNKARYRVIQEGNFSVAIAEIGAVIGLATSAVGLTGKAAETVDSIKNLLTSDKAPDADKTVKLLNTLAAELTSANMMNVELSEALKALSQELHRQDEFEREKARYEMFETSQGDIVYRLKEDMADGQPIHYICPVCLNRDKIVSFITGSSHRLCQTDSSHGYSFQKAPPISGRSSDFF